MKRKSLSLFLIVGAAMLQCCSVDALREELAPDGVRTVFDVSSPATSTDARTAIGEKKDDRYPVLWQPGDRLCINGAQSEPLPDTYEPSSSAKFVFEGVLLDSPYHAAYPASAVSAYNEGSAILTIPEAQEYVAGSFDPDAAVMFAAGSGMGLTMTMGVGFMRIRINPGSHTGHKIVRVVLKSNGTEKMSGPFSCDFRSLAESSDGKGGVRLDIPGGIELGEEVIIAFAARNYESGVRMEIVDANGHFMRRTLNAALNVEAGHIYKTSLTFEPSGMYIGTDLPSGEESTPILHTWKDMEAASPVLNSHASAYQRSCLTLIGETSVQPDTTLYQFINGHVGVCYPRFIEDGNGGWLMFYHYGNTSTWAGNYSFFLRSKDLKNWTFGQKLFNYKNNQQSPNYNSTELPKKFTRAYAGTDLCHLPDGRILAVAATRALSKYQQRPLDNGLAIRYSSDGGDTWTDDQLVMVGTCWEPYPLVLDSGVIQIYYTDSSPYYPEGNTLWGGTAVTSTGSSYIWSDDNGATWHHEDGNGEHFHAFRQVRKTATDGTRLYTDQMPVVLKLNNGAGLVGAMESAVSTYSGFRISLAYTGADGDWGVPGSDGKLPADRNDCFVAGAAPYITQFPSGETILVYNSNDVFYYQIGDATGRNFTIQRRMWEDKGFWGTLHVTGPNTLVAGLGGNRTSKSMRIGRFWLNHDIEAENLTVTADGRGDEWQGRQALYAGSTGSDQLLLRAAVSGDRLWLLAEAVAESPTVHVDLGLSGAFRRISLASQGLLSSQIEGVTAAVSPALTSDLRSGYVWELSVPLSALPSSYVPVRLAIEGDGFSDSITPATESLNAYPRIKY